jgi:predicted MPP superfamily phosphohydrolase
MHNPDFFLKLAKMGDFTILCGHTHGGQVVFPYNYEILGKKVKYLRGFFYEKNSIMYVNRGLGTSILPIRLNCPPEVTIFTLTSKY